MVRKGSFRIAGLGICFVLALSLFGCSRDSSLENAIRLGDARQVERLLEKGHDPNQEIHGRTPLKWAVSYGQQEIARVLISAGAEVDLHAASGMGDVDLASQLVESGIDIDVGDKTGSTPLYVASQTGQVEMMEWLIANGAEIAATSHAGSTPLHAAAEEEQTAAVVLLLDHGADVNAMDWMGTPLHRAVLRDNEELLDLLLSRGGKPDLMVAAMMDDADMIRQLIAEGADMNATIAWGNLSPLRVAVQKRKLSIVRILVENGANVNAVDDFGYSLLHDTVRRMPDLSRSFTRLWPFGDQQHKDATDIIIFLVENGASPHVKDEHGLTPVDYAMRYGYHSLAAFMREYGKSSE